MSSSPEVDSMPNILQAAEAPLNYFLHSYGPAAEPIMYLGWVLAGLSVTIILIMGTLLAAAILRKRSPVDPARYRPRRWRTALDLYWNGTLDLRPFWTCYLFFDGPRRCREASFGARIYHNRNRLRLVVEN